MHNFALFKIGNIMQTQFIRLSDSQWQFMSPVQRKWQFNLKGIIDGKLSP